jgi:hypothetical protein
LARPNENAKKAFPRKRRVSSEREGAGKALLCLTE